MSGGGLTSQVSRRAEYEASPSAHTLHGRLTVATKADVLRRFYDVLLSDAAEKIDFTLRAIHVKGDDLISVTTHLWLASIGAPGITLDFGHVPAGGLAAYNYPGNFFKLPDTNYGQSAEDRSNILHESVHAMLDIKGPPRAGRLYVTDEAAAYVAQALFFKFDTGKHIPSAHPIFVKAVAIAKTIEGKKGAAVPTKEAEALEKLIPPEPAYKAKGITMTTPAWTDGL
jgi:hypothetical protein